MKIVEIINRDLTEAMKARDAARLSALRMIKTALKLRETELPGSIDDAEATKVLNTLLKQRRDSASCTARADAKNWRSRKKTRPA